MAVAEAQQVAKLLREYAQRTALRGGNPYRAKAYSRAADSLAALAIPLNRLIEEDRLTEIPGVGEAIADIITKLHRTGSHPSLEKLRKEIPAGVLEMLTVPGLRPEKVLRLHKDLGIASLAELEAAAKDDRIRKAKGLGASLQTKILQNLAIAKSGEGRLHLHRAAALLEHALASLAKVRPDLKHVTVAGDFRRGCELVADLALVAEGAKEEDAPAALNSSGLKVHVTDRKHFGATLLHATGSAEHLDQLRTLAERKGMTLQADGLRKGRRLMAAKEEDIYEALGLPFIEPELREGRGEIERALKGELPKLVTDRDLRGILHCHTDASDGAETLEMMAKRHAKARLSIFRRGGSLPVGALRRRTLASKRSPSSTRRSTGSTRVRQGIPDLQGNRVRYPRRRLPRLSRRVLGRFDFVVASIHGRFKLDGRSRPSASSARSPNPSHDDPRPHDRTSAACAAPAMTSISKRYCARAQSTGWPLRSMPIRGGWISTGVGTRRALELGCMMSINPDAHSIRRARSHALGRRDGPQRRRTSGSGIECHEPHTAHETS